MPRSLVTRLTLLAVTMAVALAAASGTAAIAEPTAGVSENTTRPGFDDTDDGVEPVPMVFRKAVPKFEPAKRPFGFRIVKKRPSGPRITVTTEAKAGVELTVRDIDAGYADGFSGCFPKPVFPDQKPRCALPIPGARNVVLPKGRSYLVFGGKWNGEVLKADKYRLVVVGRIGGEHWVTFKVTD